jgi:hypothetical protein
MGQQRPQTVCQWQQLPKKALETTNTSSQTRTCANITMCSSRIHNCTERAGQNMQTGRQIQQIAATAVLSELHKMNKMQINRTGTDSAAQSGT